MDLHVVLLCEHPSDPLLGRDPEQPRPWGGPQTESTARPAAPLRPTVSAMRRGGVGIQAWGIPLDLGSIWFPGPIWRVACGGPPPRLRDSATPGRVAFDKGLKRAPLIVAPLAVIAALLAGAPLLAIPFVIAFAVLYVLLVNVGARTIRNAGLKLLERRRR